MSNHSPPSSYLHSLPYISVTVDDIIVRPCLTTGPVSFRGLDVTICDRDVSESGLEVMRGVWPDLAAEYE